MAPQVRLVELEPRERLVLLAHRVPPDHLAPQAQPAQPARQAPLVRLVPQEQPDLLAPLVRRVPQVHQVPPERLAQQALLV